MNCPICNSEKSEQLLNLNSGNFDDSILYQFVKLCSCKNCGHIYNELSDDEIDELSKHYEEYAYENLSSTVSGIGDKPGSRNPTSVKRYNRLYDLISGYVKEDSKILDVGCALGGFLDFLNEKGCKNLYGIDLSEVYVDNSYGHNIKFGDACSLPFEDNSFDIIMLTQVMEHLVDIRKAVREIKRVLVDGGIVCIGVPDASKYSESYFFDFYLLLLREHVQHFDIEHLKLLLESESFELVKFTRVISPMTNDKLLFVNLNAVFYLNKNKKEFNLRDISKVFIHNQFKELDKKIEIINKFVVSQKPLYFWGISREFMYLYEQCRLKDCNIVGLIDDIIYKQENYTIDGMKIRNRLILNDATENSVLIVTATAHFELIRDKALQIGYRGEIINVRKT